MENLELIENKIENFKISNQDDLNDFKKQFLGKQSIIGNLFFNIKNIPIEKKKDYGKKINVLKSSAEKKFFKYANSLKESDNQNTSTDNIDLSLPPATNQIGSAHPLNSVKFQIIEIFKRLGFSVSDGPEIEDDWHNFTALNFPKDHPAREMQDTFFIERNPDIVLRTHTSNVQIRMMEEGKPPFKSIMPGRVFRNEAISARAHCVFHQIEGLYIDTNVSFKDLKQTIYYFIRELFGEGTKIRFRPSYFPFTEPSAEIDISCQICKGKKCQLCKYTGWVEIAGSGMVDPNVLKNCGIDPKKYSGFAFGMGIERITQLKYQINDLRLYTENDIRFLKQFRTII